MKVFLPYVELFRHPVPASLKQIKDAGFDGVECHLIGSLRSSERVRDLRREASDLGLGIRFHQGWSWETGQRNLYNRVLRPLGALVPVGTSLVDQVRNAGEDLVVLYGNRVVEAVRPNYRYQTASEHLQGKAYAMDFRSFVNAVRHSGLPVVFDTQHVLEWSANVTSVAGLPSDRAVLAERVCRRWDELGSLTEEIHLCYFDPKLGASRGRNVFLGTGVFPLTDFCAHVRATGWDGIVTPEIAGLRANRLGQVREMVARLFAQ